MIQDKTVLAVVPARGGSKGIPLKNLRKVGDQTLIEHVGNVITALQEIDRAVVSTDHPGIAQAAEVAGIAAPFIRPEAISGDFISDYDVLIHALRATEAIDERRYDLVVMLQPTSPLRTPREVTAAISMLVQGEWDSVWTVSQTDPKAHPKKQLTVEDGALGYYDPAGSEIVARQQLDPIYHRNGIAYVMTRECLTEQHSIKGTRAGALIVVGDHISIDTESDLARAEMALKRRGPIY